MIPRALHQQAQPLIRFSKPRLCSPALGHVFNSEKDHLGVVAGAVQLPSIEQHRFLPEVGERVGYREIIEDRIRRYYLFKELPQVRDVPLMVAKFVEEAAFRFLRGHLKRLIEGPVGRYDTQIRAQHHHRLAHRIHDTLKVRARLL